MQAIVNQRRLANVCCFTSKRHRPIQIFAVDRCTKSRLFSQDGIAWYSSCIPYDRNRWQIANDRKVRCLLMIANDNKFRSEEIIKSTVCRQCVRSVNRDCNILNEQNIVPILLAAFSARFLETAAGNRAYMIARSQFDRNPFKTIAEIEHWFYLLRSSSIIWKHTSVLLGVGVSNHMQIAFLEVCD